MGKVPRKGRRFFALSFLVLILSTIMTGSTQGAALADNTGIMARICPADKYPEIEIVDNGAGGMFDMPWVDETSFEDPTTVGHLPNDATVYGQYGMAGLHWHTIQAHCLDKVMTYFQRTFADGTLSASQSIAHTGIVVYAYSLSDGLLLRVSLIFSNIMENLRDNVFFPYLTPVVMLGSAWMAWQGLVRKRFTLSVEGAGWMIFVTVFTIWLLAAPFSVMQGATKFVNGFTAVTNSAVTAGMGGAIGSGGTGTCPPGMYGDDSPLEGVTPLTVEKAPWESWNNYFVRINSDQMYAHLVCRPWLDGYFGKTDIGESAAHRYGFELLQSQAVNRIELSRMFDEENRDNENYLEDDLYPDKNALYEQVRVDVESIYPEIYPMFAGDMPGDRAGIAGMALAGNILVTAVVLVISVALIVVKLAFLVALLVFPFIGLLSVFPGFGKTIFFQWLEITVGLLLKQIVLSFIVALYVGLASEIMQVGSFGSAVLILFSFILVLLVYRRHFSHLFTTATNTTAGRIAARASELHETRAARNVLPPAAYMAAQKWGWRNKFKIGAVAGVAGSLGSQAAATNRLPADAPTPPGLHGKASQALDRVTGERTPDPGRGAHSWAKRHLDQATRPEQAPPIRPSERTSGAAPAPTPTPADSTSAERRGGPAVPRTQESPPELYGRRKGMLGRRDPVPPREGGGSAAPKLVLPERSPRSSPWFERTASEAPPRVPIAKSWTGPLSRREAVPWSVEQPRKKGVPWKMRPFGDKGGQ